MEHLSILVVEDEPEVLEMMAKVLKVAGHRVLAVSKAEQALRILELEDVNVLLTDLGLPAMSGYELMRETRRRFPRVAVVVVSGFPDPFAEEPSPDAFVPKPFPGLERLTQAIDQAMATRRKAATAHPPRPMAERLLRSR